MVEEAKIGVIFFRLFTHPKNVGNIDPRNIRKNDTISHPIWSLYLSSEVMFMINCISIPI